MQFLQFLSNNLGNIIQLIFNGKYGFTLREKVGKEIFGTLASIIII